MENRNGCPTDLNVIDWTNVSIVSFRKGDHILDTFGSGPQPLDGKTIVFLGHFIILKESLHSM